MILPKKRDPSFITLLRGGTLDCAQYVLHLIEEMQQNDDRPLRAIELAYAWARG
jgi:hypothetical protein